MPATQKDKAAAFRALHEQPRAFVIANAWDAGGAAAFGFRTFWIDRAGQPPESFDAVEVTGSPELKMKIAGGVHGDIATASITVNSIPKVMAAAPGLHTMRDMPIPSFFPGA